MIIFKEYQTVIIPILFDIQIYDIKLHYIDNIQERIHWIRDLPFNAETGILMNLDGTDYRGGGLIIPIISMNTIQEKLTLEMISNFLQESKKKITNINLRPWTLGLYKFSNSNRVSIDLNIIADVKNLDVAILFARMAGQESLFNWESGENIKTGADGSNPVNFNCEELKEISAALSEGRMPNIFDK